jgi:dolichol-phosphate mannosyltransferase
MLSAFGVILLVLSGGIASFTIGAKLLFPDIAPKGITTTLFAIIFFGSINLFAISLIGDYIAKIFEEVKARPHFIRRTIIRDGELRSAA